MSIINKLTLRHLAENKRRTVITTFGICVSVAMITAVFVAVASFLNLFAEIEFMSGGHKHAVCSVNASQIQQLKNDDRIARVGIEAYTGADEFYLNEKTSLTNGIGSIFVGDITNLKQMITGDYEGTIPKNENEIAVEKSLIEKNNLSWKIGDKVEIPTGVRYVDDNGERALISGPYIHAEEFETLKTEEYTITAILNTNPATIGRYSILRGFDSSKISADNDGLYSAYIELNEVNSHSLDELRQIMTDYKIEEFEINDDYLEMFFSFDENSMVKNQILPTTAIILAIIMIASVILIYNAFGMSLSERVRYLGMLASVGATKAQKRGSVYFEGLILGAIGIPLGIIGGVIGIGITLKALGAEIISTGMIRGINESNISMKVLVPLWAVAGIVLFSVLTILISSYIPSKKASAVTPVNAIKQSDEIKLKAKRLKNPKWVKAIFGYEGELAYKNLKRNGRKSRVITASIAISVILFLSCNYFCEMFTHATDMEMSVSYQIMVNVSYDEKDKLIDGVKELSGVNKYYSVNNIYLKHKFDENDPFASKENLNGEYKKLFNNQKSVFLDFVDDKDFNALCSANNIDYRQFYSNEPCAVLLNNLNRENKSDKPFNDNIIGKELEVNGQSIKVAGLADYDSSSYVCNLNQSQTIALYMPESAYQRFFQSEDAVYYLGIETDSSSELTEELYKLLDEGDFSLSAVSDFNEAYQVMNTIAYIIEVLVYGFIVLITLITTANILNTISTSVDLRRKEFAMLKSVGITPKGFKKMISLESLLYAIKALVFALPISVLLSFAMNRAMTSTDIFPFKIDPLTYGGVILAVFLLVGISMLYGVKKADKDSIVETLKEEIC